MAALAAIAVLSACAATGPARPPEELVAERAQAYIDAMLSGDFQAAHGMLVESAQERLSVDDYRQRYAGVGGWVAGQVTDVQCEPERCEVRWLLRYRMMFRGSLESEQVQEQVWLLERGQWRLYAN